MECRLDRRPVRNHGGPVDRVRHRGQSIDEYGSGSVGVDPGRSAVGDGDNERLHSRCHSPDRPPVFDSNRMSVMIARLSTALTMSTTVNAAMLTAVSASISTPVRSAVRTAA